jgi:IS5 family transposase
MSSTWSAFVEPTTREQQILRLCKNRPLYRFLRVHRHLIFDDELVAELNSMYAEAGRGRPPGSPVRLAMAMLLQVAFDEADSEVPMLTAVDLRWRMVLDLLGSPEQPAFSQGTVFNFRQRAIEHGFAEKLLEKTVEVARRTKGFSHKRLRAVIDSSPLLGAGRVEDTINLIGRAIGQLVRVAALESGRRPDALAEELSLTVFSASSVKAALDVDWRLPEARPEALDTLLGQFRRLEGWLSEQFTEDERGSPPLSESIETVERLIEQDTEPDPDPVRQGLRRKRTNKRSDGKRDRQISLSDPDMRNGRKSKTKLFAGYKRHIAGDMDIPGLVCAVTVLPANVREHEGAAPLLEGLESRGWVLSELHADRGYLPAHALHERREAGMKVVSKPPTPARKDGRFGKADFGIDVDAGIVTCPAGQTAPIGLGKKPAARFRRSTCRGCALQEKCLPDSGQRVVTMHPYEAFHQQMAAELGTTEGRAARRERTVVEHALAHVGAVQGRRARFKGLAKNQFDLERSAAVRNLYVIDRLLKAA